MVIESWGVWGVSLNFCAHSNATHHSYGSDGLWLGLGLVMVMVWIKMLGRIRTKGLSLEVSSGID